MVIPISSMGGSYTYLYMPELFLNEEIVLLECEKTELLFSFASLSSPPMAEERDDTRTNKHPESGGFYRTIPTFVKELLAGGVAGGVAKTAVAPLERVKILFQTRRADFQSIGLLGSFKRIFQTEGVLGFYRGNGASVARIVPYAALHYMAYEQYRRWMLLYVPGIGRGPVLDLVSGSISGGTSVLFTYPLDLVRTKLAYQVVGPSHLNAKHLSQTEQVYKGIFDCLSKIYKANGIRGLYRGAGMILTTLVDGLANLV